MAKRRIEKKLSQKIAEYAQDKMTDVEKVIVARKTYLMTHKHDIIDLIESGYPYKIIAEYITKELLETDVPKSFVTIDSEGKETLQETTIPQDLIKEFYHSTK